jgi:hypothetical protein
MSQAYRTKSFTVDSESHPLVVHCSDPRYQPHFQDFLVSGLQLERYALIAVPGGAHFLAEEAAAQNGFGMGWRWLKFVHTVARAKRIILIGHADCLWYHELHASEAPRDVRQRVCDDLRRVRENLAARFPLARTELFFACLDGRQAVIEPVE